MDTCAYILSVPAPQSRLLVGFELTPLVGFRMSVGFEWTDGPGGFDIRASVKMSRQGINLTRVVQAGMAQTDYMMS